MRIALATLCAMLISACSIRPGEIQAIYCYGLVGTGGQFAPVYPPSQGVLPGAVLEMQLYDGWDTKPQACIPFDTLRRGDDVNVYKDTVLLPNVHAEVSSSGNVTLGALSLNLGVAADFSRSRYVDLGFDDVARVRGMAPPIDVIIDVPLRGRVLNESIWPLDEYKDKRGPCRNKRYSLYIYKVDEVYRAGKVRYTLATDRSANAGVNASRVISNLYATTGLKWNWAENGTAIFTDRPFDPPLALGLQGTLYEINSQTGRLIRFQRFPLAAKR
jgi:hypothetical protein